MAVIGIPVPVNCSRCNSSFLYELVCSHSAGYLREAKESGSLLCGNCSAEERSEEKAESTIWDVPKIDYTLFSNPINDLYSRIIQSPDVLYRIDSREFEYLVADIFTKHGFDVELTPPTRDGGVDLIACRKDNITGPNLYFIECKHWRQAKKVGVAIVRQILGITYSQPSTKGLIVTSSYFTTPAKHLEQTNKYRLTLHDYTDLIGWIELLSGK